MPKLILKRKAEIIDEFNMKSTQASCTIGSDKFNNIVIEDKLVSMTHASIERRMNGYCIQDLNSAFGTYLNEQKVEDIAPLKNGDIVQIGTHAIVFEHPLQEIEWAESEAQAPEAAKDFSVATTHQTDKPIEQGKWQTTGRLVNDEIITTESLKKAEEVALAPYYLLAIHGPYKGKRYQLRFGETKIGRDENLNDIILEKNHRGETDQSISRRHATVYFQNNSFFVRDKRSKTRTHVNQIVVPVDDDVEILPSDEIEIVSDQRSTIFRFMPEGRFDFSAPKKAGVWWVRYRSYFLRGIALLTLITGGFLVTTGFLQRATLTQKPDPFAVALIKWVTDESGIIEANSEEMPAMPSAPVVAADCNRDGFVDIITTNISNKPLLIDGASRLPKWIIDTVPAEPFSPFVSADINQDQIADLIYVSSGGRLAAIDGLFGAEIWLSPFSSAQLIGPAVVDDFNGDGLNDVGITAANGVIHLGYNSVVDMEWFEIASELPLQCPLTSADINGDGRPELLCGSERGLILLIDSSERKITGTIDVNEELNRARGTFFEDNQIRYPVGAADLNGDGQLDYIVTTLQGRIIAINGATKSRLWYDVFTNELTLTAASLLPFALGYFDNDELADLVTWTNLGEIRAYRGVGKDQQPEILWQIPNDKTSLLFPDLVAVDVNKDAKTDVVFVEKTGVLKVLDGRTGQGLLKSDIPLPRNASTALVADFGKDGTLDISAVDRDGIIYQFQSNSRTPKSTIFWGQKFGQCNNALVQASRLPTTFKADGEMAAGLLMFVGTGVATYWAKKRKRRQ